MDFIKLKRLFGRLKGISNVLSAQSTTKRVVGDDYNNVVDCIGEIIQEDISSFRLTGSYYYRSGPGDEYCSSDTIRDKLFQLISYLEYGYNISESVLEIGSLYNSIQDEELKSRCADILSAPSNFDRVINQSTQVLEDRIRKKSKSDRSLIGVNLVNKALNPDLTKTVLIASSIQEEHEGVCHICRGLMIGFRNPAHHYLTDKFSREEALKFCAFVDSMLHVIENSKLQNT